MEEKHYVIEHPEGIDTWFLWDGPIHKTGKVIKSGSIETVTNYLKQKEGSHGEIESSSK